MEKIQKYKNKKLALANRGKKRNYAFCKSQKLVYFCRILLSTATGHQNLTFGNNEIKLIFICIEKYVNSS
jgi:hypothetical protein